jgi:hypothetical protein
MNCCLPEQSTFFGACTLGSLVNRPRARRSGGSTGAIEQWGPAASTGRFVYDDRRIGLWPWSAMDRMGKEADQVHG